MLLFLHWSAATANYKFLCFTAARFICPAARMVNNISVPSVLVFIKTPGLVHPINKLGKQRTKCFILTTGSREAVSTLTRISLDHPKFQLKGTLLSCLLPQSQGMNALFIRLLTILCVLAHV